MDWEVLGYFHPCWHTSLPQSCLTLRQSTCHRNVDGFSCKPCANCGGDRNPLEAVCMQTCRLARVITQDVEDLARTGVAEQLKHPGETEIDAVCKRRPVDRGHQGPPILGGSFHVWSPKFLVQHQDHDHNLTVLKQ